MATTKEDMVADTTHMTRDGDTIAVPTDFVEKFQAEGWNLPARPEEAKPEEAKKPKEATR